MPAVAGAWTSIDSAIKTAYPSKSLEAMVNQETPLRQWMSTTLPANATWTKGGKLTFGAWLDTANNVGQMLDNTALPPTTERTETTLVLHPTAFASSFGIGEISRSAGISDQAAWNGGEIVRRTEEATSDLGKFMEQTFWLDSTGIRAYVESDTTNAFVCKLPQGVQFLYPNQLISVRTAAGAGVRDSMDLIRITLKNPDTRLITYDASSATFGRNADATVVADDPVYVTTHLTQTFTAAVAQGIRGIVDDGTYLATYLAATRATYAPKLYGQVFANGGVRRNLTESLLIKSIHQARGRSGKTPTDGWWGPGQIEKYCEFVAPDRRAVVTGKTALPNRATGYQEGDLVHYAPGATINFHMSYDVCPAEMFILAPDTFFRYVAREPAWLDKGNLLKLMPATTGYGFLAGYVAYLTAVENIASDNPYANVAIRDLKDSAYGD